MQGSVDIHCIAALHHLPHTRPTESYEGRSDVVVAAQPGHQSSRKIDDLLQSVKAGLRGSTSHGRTVLQAWENMGLDKDIGEQMRTNFEEEYNDRVGSPNC